MAGVHEDFGEKIGGAKKDLWKDRGLYADDLEAMNEREAEKFVKKDNVWKKPDYAAILEEGIPLGVVYFIKKARDGLNASPQYYRTDDTPEKRTARQKEYIKTVREQRTVSVSIQAAKLSGRVLRAAIAAVLQKMEQERTMPKVGRNSMKRLTYKDPGANTIEVSGRIRSFERYARKHQVRYHIEKELGTDPPKWTVYFKANQADALTAAFKEYTKKDLTRSSRPSLLTQLHKFKELAQSLGRDRVKNKEHGGPER